MLPAATGPILSLQLQPDGFDTVPVSDFDIFAATRFEGRGRDAPTWLEEMMEAWLLALQLVGVGLRERRQRNGGVEAPDGVCVKKIRSSSPAVTLGL
jgi:hypothetical protein